MNLLYNYLVNIQRYYVQKPNFFYLFKKNGQPSLLTRSPTYGWIDGTFLAPCSLYGGLCCSVWPPLSCLLPSPSQCSSHLFVPCRLRPILRSTFST